MPTKAEKPVFRGLSNKNVSTLSNPLIPPCRLLGPLLTGTEYSIPSNVNFPLAIRFATLPRVAPKYVLLSMYSEKMLSNI